MDSFKIVTDSSSDLLTLGSVPFQSVPLKIRTEQTEYVDDASLDVQKMVNDLYERKGRSSSSCPNAHEWLAAFGDAQYVFCVTITGTLSGSYNAALAAKDLYEEAYPDRKVYVLNSLSTGPAMALMLEKIDEWIGQGLSFDEIAERLPAYRSKAKLLFVLESMKNLANNGRVKPLVAKMAGVLGIRAVGVASDRGDLQMIAKCRGEKKTLETVVEYLKTVGVVGRKIRIAHCFNERVAQALTEKLREAIPTLPPIELYNSRGLCSFYAEKGGLLVGFEAP